MIDWIGVLANFLWVFALALALSTLSYASWQASLHGEKLKLLLNLNGYQAIFNLAGVLFCAGLAITAQSTALRIVWAAIGFGFALLSINSLRGIIAGRN